LGLICDGTTSALHLVEIGCHNFVAA